MYDRAYFVPTHRPITAEAGERHFLEVQHARRNCGVDLPLIVVDDGSTNASAMRDWAAKFRDVPAYYFTSDEVTAVYDAVAARLPKAARDALRQLYPDGHINYGRVYNKIYVLAAALGARQVHRRDSDTYAQVVRRNDQDSYLFPVELEVELLDKQVEGRPVWLVGGGYTGKWSIDIDHLIVDPDTRDLRRFFNCLSIPEEEHDVVLHEHIRGNSAPYQSDKLEVDSNKEPDCGNMAMVEVFEHLPCSPVRYALGGDYFTFACLIEANLGRVYHNRAVVHAHTPCRYDNREKLFGYWRATAALVVYQDFYRAYFRHLRRAAVGHPNVNQAAGLAKLVRESMSEFWHRYLEQPSSVHARLVDFYEVIDKRREPLLTRVLEEIRANEAGIIALVQASVVEHLQLMEHWQTIIDAVKEQRGSSEIASVLRRALVQP